MTHVSNLAASNNLLAALFRTQGRVDALQTQIATGKTSQSYAGLAGSSARLVSVETLRVQLDKFTETNTIADSRLATSEQVIESARVTIAEFRAVLLDEGGREPLRQEQVAEMQRAAFRALQAMEGGLNTDLDGRYLFAGSRLTSAPVDLELSTLEDFQQRFDGEGVAFPTTREGQLQDVSLTAAGPWLTFAEDGGGGNSRVTATSARFAGLAVGATIDLGGTGTANDGRHTITAVDPGGQWIELATKKFGNETATAATVSFGEAGRLTHAETGDLVFDAATSRVSATTPDSLRDIPVGGAIRIAGTSGNDGVFTVTANDGTTLAIAPHKLVDQTTPVTGTITATGYFRGDQVARTVRVGDDRAFTSDLTAAHPAFEKAIRAMGLIAQGAFGTAGGLDQNPERIEAALWLLNDSLDAAHGGQPPHDDERAGTLRDVAGDVGYQRVMIRDANELNKQLSARLESDADTIENIDPQEAIARFLDQTRSLEAAYRAVASIRQLSLVNFL